MVELFANSGSPDQTSRSAAFDLGLHFTRLGVSSLQWIKGTGIVTLGLFFAIISAKGDRMFDILSALLYLVPFERGLFQNRKNWLPMEAFVLRFRIEPFFQMKGRTILTVVSLEGEKQRSRRTCLKRKSLTKYKF